MCWFQIRPCAWDKHSKAAVMAGQHRQPGNGEVQPSGPGDMSLIRTQYRHNSKAALQVLNYKQNQLLSCQFSHM